MNFYSDLRAQADLSCYTPGRDNKPVLVLVCHNTAGPSDLDYKDRATSQKYSDAAANYLRKNDRQVSAHFLVGGEACNAPIYYIIDAKDTAYHCGGTPPQYPSQWTNPDNKQIFGGYGLNEVAIGIELYGQVGYTVGPNQTRALTELVQWLVGQFPILAKPGHIVTHASLEGDRTDGPNWIGIALGAAAQGAKVDNTVYNGPGSDPNSWHYVYPDKKEFWVDNTYGFLAFHRANNGMRFFGLPISGARPENGRVVQLFERARFEAKYDTAGKLLEPDLGLVCKELYKL